MKNILLFSMFLVFMESVFGETVSVKEGDQVTLRSGLPEIKTDDVIDWRFGVDQILIARVRKHNTATIFDEALGRKFQGRLKLDGQTGDLTITDIKTTDSGGYEVTNSIDTYRKTVRVNVDSGLSPAAIAGIVIAVVVVVLAVAGAGIYFGYVKKRQML